MSKSGCLQPLLPSWAGRFYPSQRIDQDRSYATINGPSCAARRPRIISPSITLSTKRSRSEATQRSFAGASDALARRLFFLLRTMSGLAS